MHQTWSANGYPRHVPLEDLIEMARRDALVEEVREEMSGGVFLSVDGDAFVLPREAAWAFLHNVVHHAATMNPRLAHRLYAAARGV